MTISKKDAKLLILLLGIIILVVAYLVVYNPYVEKTDAVIAETAALEPRYAELQGYYAELDNYYAAIDEDNDAIEQELLNYPSSVRAEDLVMYAIELEDKVGVDITAIAFSEPMELLTFHSAGKDADGTDLYRELTAWQTGMTISCAMGYEQLKDMLSTINGEESRTALESLNVSYNSEDGQLLGDAVINKFFVSSADDVYEPTDVPEVSLGTDDLFGTLGVDADGESPDAAGEVIIID